MRPAEKPAFLLATDLHPADRPWPEAEAYARAVAASCAPMLGFEPVVQLAPIDIMPAQEGASEIFVFPIALDFNLLQRETLGRALGEARRLHPEVTFHHDDIDP